MLRDDRIQFTPSSTPRGFLSAPLFCLCVALVTVACGEGSGDKELDGGAGGRDRDAAGDESDGDVNPADAEAEEQDGGGRPDGSAPDAGAPVTTQGKISTAGGTVTLTGVDGVVTTTIDVPANAVKEETPVTISTASLSDAAPAGVEQLAPGFSIDLNGVTLSVPAKARLRMPLAPASGELIILAITDVGSHQVKYMLEDEGGVTYAAFEVKEGGRYLALRLVPGDGCTRTLSSPPNVSTQANLDALADVKRIVGSLQINGTAITSLAGLKCLQQLDGSLSIGNSNLESLAGLERLTFIGADSAVYYAGYGLSITNNSRLAKVELPSLLSVGYARNNQTSQINVSANPLLASFKLPTIESAGMAFSNNGAAATSTSLDLPALTRAQVLTITNNPSLHDLSGLGSLQIVASTLSIQMNIGLENLDGMARLVRAGALTVGSNAALTSASGLSKLRKAESLAVNDNPLLKSLTLPELSELAGTAAGALRITHNDALARFEANKLTAIGSFAFTGNGNATENTELSMSALAQVMSGVEISQNLGLKSLAGLSALKSAGAFTVSNNAALESTTGLGAVETLADLRITGNAKLTEVGGLDNLTRIDQGVTVNQNAQLRKISVPKLATLGQALNVTTNAALQSLSLPALRVVPQNLSFTGNGQAGTPTTLALPMLSAVTQSLSIQNNPGLAQVDGLSALTSVGGSVTVQSNAALTSLNGLSALGTITGGLTIQSNAQLPNLGGLANLTRVSGVTVISSNAALVSAALPKLTTAGASLTVSNNAQLASVQADALTSVSGSLALSSNGSAASVTITTFSFPQLTTLQGTLNVLSNPKLSALDGFPRLTGVGGFSVSNNVLLPTCAAVALRNQIQTNGSLSGVGSISGNLSDGCMP